MAAKGLNLLTLADVAKSKNKNIGKVAEVLTEENPMLNDVPYQVMNEGTIHKEDIRSALPDVFYRKANQPIPATKTTIEERSFGAAHFESKSVIDEAVAKRGGIEMIAYNRWNQAMGHLQAQALEMAQLLIYGSPATANRKTAGLFDIYSTLSASEETSKQIIDAGGVGSDNCSIVKVHWGERAVFGVYPKGTTSGITRTDRSPKNQLVQIQGTDENGDAGHFWGYEENFMSDHGLVVKDFRQAARICNIDTSDLAAGTGANLTDLMISADHLIHNDSNGQGIWYVNKTVKAALHKQALEQTSVGGGLTFENYQGKEILHFLGSPVRRSDALLNSEARVV